ncbi:hypothetical protein [Sandarakinorhabdus sp. AAP62]|uniref:hypothetical protein n=1 Tax=Sandarakinorhabdus sp. AAP62 TaxID=1248916 RepID=UPI0002D869CB|nr:hypothetical protein [Sandarakinorhabdus sp. AAP62]
MSLWRPQFDAALTVLAEVSDAVAAQGFPRPVLVGGAAAELYSGSAIATGDFDLVAIRQDVVEAALQARGFVKPSGPGLLTRGWVHPDLALGFEIVADTLMDGHADRDRIRLFAVNSGEKLAVIPIEDLIADRVAQYHSGTASEMLEQARLLSRLAEHLDEDYLERRIREETGGDHGRTILETR